MRRNPLMPPRRKHGANRSAATAMVVGAGLACAAGSSWGSPLSAGEIADAPDMALTSVAPVEPDGLAPTAETFRATAGRKPVDEGNLNAMRGGFDEDACPALVEAVRSRVTEPVVATADGKDAQAPEARASSPDADAGGKAHLQQAGGPAEGPLQADLHSGAAEPAPAPALASPHHVGEHEAVPMTANRAPAREKRLEAARSGSKAATASPIPASDPIGKVLPLVSREANGAAAPARGRGKLAAWKPVTEDRLDELRGGFDVGGLQASFGIERAVFINGSLVVSTSLTIPDISRITTAQASQLAAALAPVANVGAVASAAASTAVAPQQGQAAVAAAANGSAGAAGATAASAAASSGTAAALPVTVIPTANGTVVTNGQQLVVQNGLNNTLVTGAQGTSPATLIQNTLNGQSIQSLTTINVGVNTLQAYRAAVASTVLNDTLLNAAGRR